MKEWFRASLCLAVLLAALPTLHAQAIPTADRTSRIQAGGGAMVLSPDYTQGTIIGFSVWGDYDFSKYVGLEVSTHFGEFITPGDISEDSYFVGPRIFYRHRRVTVYGKALAGRATITNQDYNLASSYNVFAFGGGVEYRLLRKVNVRVIDFEQQSWPDFPPSALSPTTMSFGASYIIH